MNKTAMTAAAAALSALALTGANAQETGNAADQCVWNEFNKVAANFTDIPGVSLKLSFAIDDLKNMVTLCEEQTGTQAETFKDVQAFSTTINAVTFEFK